MEYHRSLEITIISADGIKDVNMFGKMDVYAVVSIIGYSVTKKKKTNVDMNCGTRPRWNHKMQFIIDERSLYNRNLFLVVQLKANKPIGDKNIGEVTVHISELFENGNACFAKGNGDATAKAVEYQVKTSTGKPKGTLRFSFRFSDKRPYDNNVNMNKTGEFVTTAYPVGNGHGQPGASEPATGYPYPYPYPFHPTRMVTPGRGYPGHPPSPPPPPPPPPPQGCGGYPPPGGMPTWLWTFTTSRLLTSTARKVA